jgi:CheY-like chemotaxis protein
VREVQLVGFADVGPLTFRSPMAKILIVANDANDREIFGLIVELRGHTCATTGSLEEAVNLLQKGFFDLVLTELNVVGNSAQILKHLKSGYPNSAVVVLTQSGETIESADETIALPCSPEALISRIERVLGNVIGLRAKSRTEKRRFARYLVELPCWVRDLRGSQRVEGRTVDVSRCGIYFLTTGEWKAGAAIECLIQLASSALGEGSKAIRSEGRIVRTVPDKHGGIGIGATIERHEFVDLVVKGQVANRPTPPGMK